MKKTISSKAIFQDRLGQVLWEGVPQRLYQTGEKISPPNFPDGVFVVVDVRCDALGCLPSDDGGVMLVTLIPLESVGDESQAQENAGANGDQIIQPGHALYERTPVEQAVIELADASRLLAAAINALNLAPGIRSYTDTVCQHCDKVLELVGALPGEDITTAADETAG